MTSGVDAIFLTLYYTKGRENIHGLLLIGVFMGLFFFRFFDKVELCRDFFLIYCLS